jgi:hypothetical protein
MAWKGVVFEDSARSSLLMLPANFADMLATRLQADHADSSGVSPFGNPMERNFGGLYVNYSLDTASQTIVVHDINTKPSAQRRHADPR